MKKLFLTLAILIVASVTYSAKASSNNASILFNNQSDYTMVLRIVGINGGLYTTVSLPAHSSRTVNFGNTATYKLKIQATHYGNTSYHDGGNFSVTCNNYEYTEGVMSFRMSTYGTGLGRSISAKEFMSDY